MGLARGFQIAGADRVLASLWRIADRSTSRMMEAFYRRLLDCLKSPALRNGKWQLLACAPAAQDNESWDGFIASAWQGPDGERLLVVVNYAPRQGQCYVRIPFDDLEGGSYRLSDLLSAASYERDGDTLLAPGLYLDLAPWGYHLFQLRKVS